MGGTVAVLLTDLFYPRLLRALRYAFRPRFKEEKRFLNLYSFPRRKNGQRAYVCVRVICVPCMDVILGAKDIYLQSVSTRALNQIPQRVAIIQ